MSNQSKDYCQSDNSVVEDKSSSKVVSGSAVTSCYGQAAAAGGTAVKQHRGAAEAVSHSLRSRSEESLLDPVGSVGSSKSEKLKLSFGGDGGRAKSGSPAAAGSGTSYR